MASSWDEAPASSQDALSTVSTDTQCKLVGAGTVRAFLRGGIGEGSGGEGEGAAVDRRK